MYVHDGSDLRTVAHEYTHVWQQFGGLDDFNDSSIWIPEGLAELDGTLSLVVSGDWTLAQANGFFQDDAQNATVPPFNDTPLSKATYENAAQQVAYVKGALVVQLLDESIQFNTNGRYGLADVLQVINRESVAGSLPGDVLTNEALLKAINNVTAAAATTGGAPDFTSFFQKYVYGTAWPSWTPGLASGGAPHFEELYGRGDPVVDNLTTTPPIAVSGQNATVTVTIDNRGLAPAQATFRLLLDGAKVGEDTVSLDLAQRVVLSFTVTAPQPGSHTLAIGQATVPWPVAHPPRLEAGTISSIPPQPLAGSTTDLLVGVTNVGDFATTGQVILLVDGASAGSRNVTVGANSASIADFSLIFGTPGLHNLTIRIYGADGSFASRTASFPIAAGSDTTAGNPFGPLGKLVPAPGSGALVSILAIVGLASVAWSAPRQARLRERR
jgi:hypothetical protein